jgi:hypothetical protein
MRVSVWDKSRLAGDRSQGVSEVIAACRINIEKSLLFFRVIGTRASWDQEVGALLRAVGASGA